jgi:hypothetical protein
MVSTPSTKVRASFFISTFSSGASRFCKWSKKSSFQKDLVLQGAKGYRAIKTVAVHPIMRMAY